MAQRSRNSRRKDSAPGWVWMLFGLGIGLAVAIGVYLRLPAKPAAVETPKASAASTTPRATAAPQRERPAAPGAASDSSRFQFYEILPQLEVAVPDDRSRPATDRPRPNEAPGSFLLQAGSFSAAGDADRLQANLALLGFESHVQSVTIDNAIFHRVRIGPIGDAEAAKRAQRELREAGIDSLLMRVPK